MIVNRCKIYFFRLIFCFFSTFFIFGFVISEQISRDVVIVFDLDETLITPQLFKRNCAMIWKSLPWNLGALIGLQTDQEKALYSYKRSKAAINLIDVFASSGGTAISLLFYGIYGNNTKNFQAFIPLILDANWEYTVFTPGAKILLDYLSNKGYFLVYATNKDYISYIKVAEKLNAKYNNSFTRYPSIVLVTQPTKEWQDQWFACIDNVPQNFSDLLNAVKAAKEHNGIYFAPEGYKKPRAMYYEKLCSLIKAKQPNVKKILFFDDKEYNIVGAGKNNITGYLTKTVADIVHGLEVEGVLDRITDNELFKKLVNEGVLTA